VDVSGFVCADIGASTGGFTDCLLQKGANKVYAVGRRITHNRYKLRVDPRVALIERKNARGLTPETLGGPDVRVDFAVVDVSFISLRLILGPVKSVLKAGGRVIALVKPQFEVGRENVGKGGIVRDKAAREGALGAVKEFAAGLGFAVLGEMESPVRGAKGNVEYLIYLENSDAG